MAKTSEKPRLRRTRLAEQLTTKICKHIVERKLKPGDPLWTEREMIKRFGVSHSVVREATKALDFLGIIHAAPRRGMVLDDFSFDRVSKYFGFHFALTDYPKEKLLKARTVIETGTLIYTMEAMRKTPDLYPRLCALADAIPSTVGLDDQWIAYDIAFHRGLVEASDITPLAAFCDLLEVFFERFRGRLAVGDFHSGSRDHRRIVDALHQGHLDEATHLLRSHMLWYEDCNNEDP
jgi:DNA-binding FadR family transcriptional regulator